MEKKNKSKSLGNSFERKIAKELSIWMFNDQHVLKREPTSGATKNVYCGDIFPMKQINWEVWPFHIECKYGYSQFTPTLLSYPIIEKWYLKALAESKITENQNIILLICNFKNKKGIMVFTNKKLKKILYKSIICIKTNGILENVYCYDYNEMLKYNFESVFC